MFARPEDRLKQMLVPRLQRLLGQPPTQYYRDFAALTGVSLEIRRGETVGIIGRNGSGKSTLLQIVCGTLQPTEGTVSVNGRIAALLELGAGFNPEFTGRENVYLNAAIIGLARPEIDSRFDAIASFADIGEFIDQPVKIYSSGMYVRLAFATAINVDPDILVVDEALAVGDEAFQRKCFVRIEQIRERGGTILFVSHSADMIVQLCDRAMLFDRGEKLLEGTPKFVTRQYQRLINLSGAAAEEVREAIRGGVEGEPPDDTPADLPAVPHSVPPASPRKGPQNDSWFDPGLASKSVVNYESQGAEITDLHITEADGARVNVLRMRRRYFFQYDVTFKRSAKNLFFGMLVNTVNGVGIGGVGSRTMLPRDVAGDTRLRVRFAFETVMLPGTYFVNAGVLGEAGPESTSAYLHRVLDGYAFRVMQEDGLEATGLVDLAITGQVTVMGTLAD